MFLIHYASQEYENFREAELFSLADINSVVLDKSRLSTHDWNDPLLILKDISEVDFLKLIQSSVLIKNGYEIWCTACSYSELYQKICELSHELTDPYINNSSSTFKITVESLKKKLSHPDKISLIENILEAHSKHDEFTSTVSLNNPTHELALLIEYESCPLKGRVSENRVSNLYYTRKLTADSTLRYEALNRFKLSERCFIGNTSMEVILAFLMSILSRVGGGSLVYDPFVGTGSILLACGRMGGYGLGLDIDYNIVHARGKSSRADKVWRSSDESLISNYRQYGLENLFLDSLVGDASMSSLWRCSEWVDAIVTDPPYGIREAAKKVAKIERDRADLSLPHYPQKETYQLSAIFSDLLLLAARLLRVGGYLTYWLPVARSVFDPERHLPRHACFQLVHNLEQVMNARISRRLIVMQKISSFENDNPDHLSVCGDSKEHAAFRAHYFKLASEAQSS